MIYHDVLLLVTVPYILCKYRLIYCTTITHHSTKYKNLFQYSTKLGNSNYSNSSLGADINLIVR